MITQDLTLSEEIKTASLLKEEDSVAWSDMEWRA